MKREILFRGKRVDNGEWVEGYYYQLGSHHYIRKDIHVWEVIPETVGQLTGLIDKNGVKIFEGDIVTDGSCNAKIFYNSIYAQFMADFSPIEDSPQEIDQLLMWAKVIGNIHDNPELLK